jgi:hypothetical protein
MAYPYPPNFPQTSRARVKAEETRAGRDLAHAKQRGGASSLEPDVLRAVLRAVVVFSDEALKLVVCGKQINDYPARREHA